jgi:hypothetical protein
MENVHLRLESLEAEMRSLRAETLAMERRWRARCALAWMVSLLALALLGLSSSTWSLTANAGMLSTESRAAALESSLQRVYIDLINAATNKGAALVADQRTETGAAARTVRQALDDRLSLLDFSGVDPTGATDSSAGFQNAIHAAIRGTRGRELYLPPGDYRIDSTLTIANVRGFRLVGSGNTLLRWHGNNSSPLLLLQDVNEGVFEGFNIVSAGSGFPLSVAVRIENGSGTAWIPAACHFRDIDIDGGNSTHLGTGFLITSTGAGGDANNEFHRFDNVAVSNAGTAAWKIDASQAHGIFFTDCQAHTTVRGVQCASGNFVWHGGFMSGMTVACFDLGSPQVTIPYRISNMGSEGCTRFLVTGGPTGAAFPLVVEQIRFSTADGALAGDGIALDYRSPGPLVVRDSCFGDDATRAVKFNWTYLDSGDTPIYVSFQNVQIKTNLTTAATIFPSTEPTILSRVDAMDGRITRRLDGTQSVDTSARAVSATTVRAALGQNSFQYLKPDGSNLLRAAWDGGNFHHYLGGSLYYNLGGNNLIFESQGGMVGFNGTCYIDGSARAPGGPRVGSLTYATAENRLTSAPFLMEVFAWNGADGSTLHTAAQAVLRQVSAANDDAHLDFELPSGSPRLRLDSGTGQVRVLGPLVVGSGGTPLTSYKIYNPTLSPARVAANTTTEQTFTVTGLSTADRISFVNKPTAQTGLGIVGYRVSATDTLAITFLNLTALPITPRADEIYQVGAIRSQL